MLMVVDICRNIWDTLYTMLCHRYIEIRTHIRWYMLKVVDTSIYQNGWYTLIFEYAVASTLCSQYAHIRRNIRKHPRWGTSFIVLKAVAPTSSANYEGHVHSKDPCLECINALLPPQKEPPAFEQIEQSLSWKTGVPCLQFSTPRSRTTRRCDGPLQPSRSLTILIVVDAVEDLLAAGVQG
jgi:hypothetical protein